MKFPLCELERAQTLLRERVLMEILKMDKESIKHICKMSNFEDFYAYLQSFREELEGEGLTIRIKKGKKQAIVESQLHQS